MDLRWQELVGSQVIYTFDTRDNVTLHVCREGIIPTAWNLMGIDSCLFHSECAKHGTRITNY